jgi:DNA-binding transcriptional regulator YiaG
MPNIANVLREEIARISRRETRKETAVLKRASVNYRREIAALKRKLAGLAKSHNRAAGIPSTEVSTDQSKTSHRFVASGFRTLRYRLGLSAAQMGTVLGVSEQSIYNWETKVAVPRRAHLPAIAQLRSKGKRDVAAMLEQQKPKAQKPKAQKSKAHKRKAQKPKAQTPKKRR